MTSPEKPKRRWWSVSLRGLMVFIIVFGVILGWRVNKARRQAKALAAIEALNSKPVDGTPIVSLSFFHEINSKGNLIRGAEPNAPRWLVEFIGPEYFRTVRGVQFDSNLLADQDLPFLDDLADLETFSLQGNPRVSDDLMTCLRSMTRLQRLWLMCTNLGDKTAENLDGLHDLKQLYLSDTKVTDAGVSHVRGLVNLQVIWLGNLDVTDASLVHLEGLTQLERLNLTGTKVTDAGLVHLESLQSLQELYLGRTGVTQAGIDRLKKRLPKTKITNQ